MDPPVPHSPRDVIKSSASEPQSAKKDREPSRDPSPSRSSGMIRQTMSLRGPVGSGHSTPGTAAEKLNAFSPVGVQQSHMNSFKMETTAKKFGRFTVSEAKQVPSTQWDAVERQQPGVFDALERQMTHDPALRVFSPLMPSLSSIRKGSMGPPPVPAAKPLNVSGSGAQAVQSPGSVASSPSHVAPPSAQALSHMQKEYHTVVSQLAHVKETLDVFARALHITGGPQAAHHGASHLGRSATAGGPPTTPSAANGQTTLLHPQVPTLPSTAGAPNPMATPTGHNLTRSTSVAGSSLKGTATETPASAAEKTKTSQQLSLKVKRLKERNEALLNCVRVLSQKLERTGQTLPAEVAKILSADPSDA